MLEQLVIVFVGLELVSTQGTCNRAIQVSHNGVSSSISYEEFKQALGKVSSTFSEALDIRCQICRQRGDLDDVPRDCQDVLDLGYRTTGVYMIYPTRSTPFKVRCDQTTAGGGWTLIQRRVSNSTDFYRTWKEYKDGFGKLDGNFWLGNDHIHTLTGSGNYRLRVDLTAPDGEKAYAEYSTFSVRDESSKYRLSVLGYSGTANDSLDTTYNHGRMFSTRDADNDEFSRSCAVEYQGAWWYGGNCGYSNLNGIYGATQRGEGINWVPFRDFDISLTESEMKIRKN